jgi:formimidoylglutamate deiminase
VTALFARRALLARGWAEDVRIEIAPDGTIARLLAGGPARGAEHLAGVVLPGMPNLHGHAFQRAMAGLAERLPDGESSFWTWRSVMYRFAERITPESLRAVAAQLYVEMLKAGYTAHAEFHYLHGTEQGGDPLPMAEALLDAAQAAGIALTLLPSLYLTGGIDGRPLEGGQRRFALDLDGFVQLLERLRGRVPLGIAPHSLRAVPPAMLRRLAEWWTVQSPGRPIHLHLAEQVREVREIMEVTGKRPGELLLETVVPDSRWCLIHATHLDDRELAALAASGAVAGLCPSTEANLGDGLFRLGDWLAAGGAIGIGSDSHVSVSPIEELRLLDYGQRLATLTRIAAATAAEPHAGASLWRGSARGGAQAVGRDAGILAPGRQADLVVVDDGHPLLAARDGDRLLDTLVFSGNVPLVRDVMVGGRWVVRDGHHPAEEAVALAYREAVAAIGE